MREHHATASKRFTPHRINLFHHQKRRFDAAKKTQKTYADYILVLLDNLFQLQSDRPCRFTSLAVDHVRCRSLGPAGDADDAADFKNVKLEDMAVDGPQAPGLADPDSSLDELLSASPEPVQAARDGSAPDDQPKLDDSHTPLDAVWRVWIPASSMAKLIVLKKRCSPPNSKKLATWEFVELLSELYELSNDTAFKVGFLELLASAPDPDTVSSASSSAQNARFSPNQYRDTGASTMSSPHSSSIAPSSSANPSQSPPSIFTPEFSPPHTPESTGIHLSHLSHLSIDTTWPTWLPGTNPNSFSDEFVSNSVGHFFKNAVGTYVSLGLLFEPHLRSNWTTQPEFLKYAILTSGLWMERRGVAPLGFIVPMFSKARELVLEAMDTLSVELIQALILLGRQSYYMGNFPLSCRFLKMAIRAAQTLQIDRPSWYKDKSWFEAEHARRAWFQCVYLNYLAAANVMAYRSIDATPLPLTVPCPPSNEYFWTNPSSWPPFFCGSEVPPGVDPYIPDYTSYILTFVQIDQQATKYLSLYNDGPPELNPETYLENQAKLEEYKAWSSVTADKLWSWYISLPEWMKDLNNLINDQQRNRFGKFSMDILQCNILYQGTLILIYFPAMIEDLWRDPDSMGDSARFPVGLRTCVTAAAILRELLKIMQKFEAENEQRTLIFSNFMPLCRMVNLITLRLNPQESIEEVLMLWFHMHKDWIYRPRPKLSRSPLEMLADLFQKRMVRIHVHSMLTPLESQIVRECVKRHRAVASPIWDIALGPWITLDLWTEVEFALTGRNEPVRFRIIDPPSLEMSSYLCQYMVNNLASIKFTQNHHACLPDVIAQTQRQVVE